MTEPLTALTDYLLAGTALIFAGFLLHMGWRKQQISVGCWGLAFGFVGVAAALGGTCHGFYPQLKGLWLDLWQTMIYSLSLASLLLLVGSIFGTARSVRVWLLLAALLKSLLLWSGWLYPLSFEAVVFDYMISLAVVLLLQLLQLRQPDSAASRWLTAGILTSGLALALLAGQASIGRFSPADLYHLVQLVGLVLLYQGAKRLRDQ